MEVNEIIRKLRTEHGMTMEELGKKVSVSKQTIQRYETGQIPNIPYDKIELLANALGVTKSQLMGWDDLPNVKNVDRDKSFHRILSYYTMLNEMEKDSALDYLKYLVDKSQTQQDQK